MAIGNMLYSLKYLAMVNNKPIYHFKIYSLRHGLRNYVHAGLIIEERSQAYGQKSSVKSKNSIKKPKLNKIYIQC